MRVLTEIMGGEQHLREALELTERESRVLFWIANGNTNREIAEILIGQQHQIPRGVGAGFPPGLLQQHKRQQPQGFRLRLQLRQKIPQVDGLGGQAGAGGTIAGRR